MNTICCYKYGNWNGAGKKKNLLNAINTNFWNIFGKLITFPEIAKTFMRLVILQ